MKEEEKRTMDIVSDMTRQYKSMQEELLNRINSLQDEVSRNDEEIKNLKVDHERVNNDK